MSTMEDSKINHHFKKRKACTSSAPGSPRCTTDTAKPRPPSIEYLFTPSRPSSPAQATTTDNVNLAAALAALTVSLKREMESFLPPTPAASPSHARSAKRPRFDFGPELNETKPTNTVFRPKASPIPKLRGTAFLSVSKKLQQELDRTSRPDSSEITLRARKRRQQLTYFAIASAFHRAAHDRGLALVPAPPVVE